MHEIKSVIFLISLRLFLVPVIHQAGTEQTLENGFNCKLLQ